MTLRILVLLLLAGEGVEQFIAQIAESGRLLGLLNHLQNA